MHTADDIAIAREITAIGQFLGIPPVAVQPVYCLAPEYTPRLRLLAAIDHNYPLEAVPAAALPEASTEIITRRPFGGQQKDA